LSVIVSATIVRLGPALGGAGLPAPVSAGGTGLARRKKMAAAAMTAARRMRRRVRMRRVFMGVTP
jgi:hypothetical protein